MYSAIFREIVNWGSMPLLAVLMGLLIRRKTVREFPYFFSYIVACELIGLVRLCFYDRHSMRYFYIYWTTDLFIAIGALLATYELFVRRLFARSQAFLFYRFLFPVAAIAIVFFASRAALQLHEFPMLIPAIHVLNVVRTASLGFFLGLMLFMGRKWGRYEFGIAIGLGIDAAAVLVTSASWTQNSRIHVLTTFLPVIAYDMACIIWLITFFRWKESAAPAASQICSAVLPQARKWEQTLKDSLAGRGD